MRSKFLPLLVVAGVTFGAAAFADTTAATTATTTAPAATATTTMKAPATPASVSGTIKKIDAKGGYIVLSNGWKYHVAKGYSLAGFKVGEKVTVTYTMNGKYHEASEIKAS